MIKKEHYNVKINGHDASIETPNPQGMSMITIGPYPANGTEEEQAEAVIDLFVGAFGLDTPFGCGKRCGSACWYQLDFRVLRADSTWACLDPECDGTLTPTGTQWLTVDAGVHHVCSACDFTVAVRQSTLDEWARVEGKGNG